LPAGFQWDTASAVDVAVSGGGCQGLSFGPSSYGSSAETGAVDQVRFPITTLSTFPCAATFGGSSAFKVKPSAASPLATGQIYLRSNSGDIAGLTSGPSGTSLGALAMVGGAISP